MASVDLTRHRGWAEVTAATLDRLETVELYRRRHHIVAQLPDTERRGRLGSWWRGRVVTGPSGVRARRPTISVRGLQIASRQAEELRAQLRTVRLEVPEPGEIRWLYARAVRRGLWSMGHP